MRATELPNHESAILTRLVWGDTPGISPVVAEAILSVGFSDSDKDRMHALTARAREGHLTTEEQAEIEAYSRIGSLLGILKSKARRALERQGANGATKTR